MYDSGRQNVLPNMNMLPYMLRTFSLHVIALQSSFTLKRKHNLKIKGDGPLKYLLGCDYHMDPDGTLVAQPQKYISKILDSFHQMFPGESLPQVKSSLDKNHHPELDNSELASSPNSCPWLAKYNGLLPLVDMTF